MMEINNKFLNISQLEEECKKEEKIIEREIKIAKKKVIYNWDKGKDGREFVEKEFALEPGYNLKVFVLENNRGLVIKWKSSIVAIGNWGESIHIFNANRKITN